MKRACDPDACRAPSAVDDANAAKRYGVLADVTLGAGVLLVAAGVIVLVAQGGSGVSF